MSSTGLLRLPSADNKYLPAVTRLNATIRRIVLTLPSLLDVNRSRPDISTIAKSTMPLVENNALKNGWASWPGGVFGSGLWRPGAHAVGRPAVQHTFQLDYRQIRRTLAIGPWQLDLRDSGTTVLRLRPASASLVSDINVRSLETGSAGSRGAVSTDVSTTRVESRGLGWTAVNEPERRNRL